MKYAIFDLDGCISDDRWRRHLAHPPWSEYHKNAIGDKLANEEVVRRHIRAGHHLLFVTARPDIYWNETLTWLECKLGELDSFSLIMRPDGDWRSSPDMKLELLARAKLPVKDIVAAYDDREDVLEAYRGIGITNPQRLTVEGTRVPRILRDMAATFEERNAQYRENYRMVAPVMKALFPDGVPSELVVSDRWHLFELIVIKLTRFAATDLGHADSIHDMAIYAAMIESDLEERK